MKRTEEHLRDLWDSIKCTSIHIIGVPEGEEKEKGPEKILEDNKIIVGDFNTPLTSRDRSSRQRINKKIQSFEPDTFDCYLQNILPQSSSIRILLKCTWNILKDRSYPGEQIKP